MNPENTNNENLAPVCEGALPSDPITPSQSCCSNVTGPVGGARPKTRVLESSSQNDSRRPNTWCTTRHSNKENGLKRSKPTTLLVPQEVDKADISPSDSDCSLNDGYIYTYKGAITSDTVVKETVPDSKRSSSPDFLEMDFDPEQSIEQESPHSNISDPHLIDDNYIPSSDDENNMTCSSRRDLMAESSDKPSDIIHGDSNLKTVGNMNIVCKACISASFDDEPPSHNEEISMPLEADNLQSFVNLHTEHPEPIVNLNIVPEECLPKEFNSQPSCSNNLSSTSSSDDDDLELFQCHFLDHDQITLNGTKDEKDMFLEDSGGGSVTECDIEPERLLLFDMYGDGASAIFYTMLKFGITVQEGLIRYLVDEVQDDKTTTIGLVNLLLARSNPKASPSQMCDILNIVSNNTVGTKFFTTRSADYSRKPKLFTAFLQKWVGRGAAPIICWNFPQTSNANRFYPGFWSYCTVENCSDYVVSLGNPRVNILQHCLNLQLTHVAEVTISKDQVMSNWHPETDLNVLSLYCRTRPFWKTYNVLGQVVRIIRDNGTSPNCSDRHVVLPIIHEPGIILCMKKDNQNYNDMMDVPSDILCK